MRNVDVRTVSVYTAITVVGFILLALVLPSISPKVLTIVLVALPLVALIVITSFIFGNSRKTRPLIGRRSSLMLANTAVVSTVVSLVATIISTRMQSVGVGKFAFENAGVAFLFLAFACALLLINKQKFVYWPLWNIRDQKNADERQKAVRNRVYEKSYRMLLILLFVLSQLTSISTQRMSHELIVVSILCVFAVPAIIAAWQKDS